MSIRVFCLLGMEIFTLRAGLLRGLISLLPLLEEDLGQVITLTVARMMVVFPRRPGGQSQFSAYVKLHEVGSKRPDIDELLAWILGHPGEDLSVAALADRMAMSPAVLRGSFAARPDRRRPDLSIEHGPTPPAANSSKPPYRSQRSLRNAASATPNACDALFSAYLMLVHTTTGRYFDHPRLCESPMDKEHRFVTEIRSDLSQANSAATG